jgi:hypothetical protein
MSEALRTAILFFCAGISGATAAGTLEATPEAYLAGPSMGVVLLDVNWGRRWSCGGFENAELRRLSFDLVPPLKSGDEEPADLTLEQPSSLFATPTFTNYALIVEPGQYVLSGFEMKVARSVSSVLMWVAKRSELIKDGNPQGGSFTVGAGEVVYIGNFWLDCFRSPQPWRYYTETPEGFKKHLAQFKDKYPFLRLDKVNYRLFETTRLGRPYSLPNQP